MNELINSLCSLYLAGTHHLDTLYLFFTSEKYYDVRIHLNKHPEQSRWSYENDKKHVNLKKTILNRCLITRDQIFVFEDELTKYWKEYLLLFDSKSIQINKLLMFSNKQYIIIERIKYLSYPYYIKLLSGHMISEDELNALYLSYTNKYKNENKIMSKQAFIKICDLSIKYDN